MNQEQEPILVWTDGGSRGNPGPSAWGVIITHGEETVSLSGFIPQATNNEAEYRAMQEALDHLNRLDETENPMEILICSDSALVVNQILGLWECRSAALEPRWLNALASYDLLREKHAARVLHVKREENREADRLCNEAMDAAGAKFQRNPRS